VRHGLRFQSGIGLREHDKAFAPGAQTKRRGGAGPVSTYVGGKTPPAALVSGLRRAGLSCGGGFPRLAARMSRQPADDTPRRQTRPGIGERSAFLDLPRPWAGLGGPRPSLLPPRSETLLEPTVRRFPSSTAPSAETYQPSARFFGRERCLFVHDIVRWGQRCSSRRRTGNPQLIAARSRTVV
jgi:hypothetical protein